MNPLSRGARSGASLNAFYRKYGIFLIMILLFVAASILNKNFIKPQNLINVLKQVTPFGIVACAETMLIVSGCIDLSAGTTLALCACLGAGTIVNTGSVALGFLVAMAAGMAVGYINGILVTRFKLPPFIATLAMMNVAEGITYIYTGGKTISGVGKLKWLGQGALLGIPYMILLFIVVLVIIQLVMKKTRFGLYMYSIGGNRNASIAAGINVSRNIRLTYVLAGALVGIAGIAITARMLSGQSTVGPGYEFDAITATIVGGTSFNGGIGSMFCVITGSIIIGIINNVMILMGVDSNWQLIVKGMLIAVAVILDISTKSSSLRMRRAGRAGKARLKSDTAG